MPWTVCENQIGCLPDTEPATFDTRQEAMNYAMDEMCNARDGYDVGDETGDEFHAAWQTLLGLQSWESDVYVSLPMGRVLTVEHTSAEDAR